MKTPAAQRGFTLLEVMVATAILAIGLSAVSGGLGMTARATALAAGYERARQVAETQLALFLAAQPDTEQAASAAGDDDGVRWQLRAEPQLDQPGLLQVAIEAHFFAAGERTLRLQTFEVSRVLPEQERSEKEKSAKDDQQTTEQPAATDGDDSSNTETS